MAPVVPSRPFDLCLVGAGKAGTAVAMALQAAGNRVVGVASRTEASAARAAERLGADVMPPGDLPPCDVFLLGVPDAALAETSAGLVAHARRAKVMWHLSGSFGVGVLPDGAAPLRCALHPVQAFPDPDAGMARLPGSSWGVTCDEAIRPWAHSVVVEDLGGHPVDVREDDRPVWHAAAVTTANGIGALMSLAETLLGSIGINDAGTVLGPLASAAVHHAAARGATLSLTGPAVRGEWATVATHVRSLESGQPGLLESYLEATRLIFRAAERAGKVTPEARAAAATILGGAS